MCSNLPGCSPSQLSDPALLGRLSEVAARDRATTAELLALIAEVDARALYREQGCDSMYVYCRRELRMSEDVATRRICAARAARRFPGILSAVADGRLNVSAINQLSPYLETPRGAQLLLEAEGLTRRQIEDLVARHFPRPDLPTLVHVPEAAAASAVPTVPAAQTLTATSEARPVSPADSCSDVATLS